MAKRSSFSSTRRMIDDVVEIPDTDIDDDLSIIVDESTVSRPTTVRIRSRRDMYILVAGKVSGRTYEFPHAGVEVEVDEQDAYQLLKRMGKGCCGSPNYPWFEQVGG